MGPRFVVDHHTDPTNDIYSEELFDLQSPFMQAYLASRSDAMRNRLRAGLEQERDLAMRRVATLPSQLKLDGSVGNTSDLVTIGQTRLGTCSVMGTGVFQEDGISYDAIPEFALLGKSEKDYVAAETFRRMQNQHGKDMIGIGSTMSVTTAWKQTNKDGGHSIEIQTANVGDSPAYIVIVNGNGNVTCEKLTTKNQGRIGDSMEAAVELSHNPDLEPHSYPVLNNERVFIVTGGHAMVHGLGDDAAREEEAISKIFIDHPDSTMDTIARELTKRSVAQGTQANVSCAVFEVSTTCTSVNVNDGNGGREVSRPLTANVYPTMRELARNELEYKTKIQTLLKQLDAASGIYTDYGHTKHLEAITNLHTDLNTIFETQRSSEEKYQEMLRRVKSAFATAEGKYRRTHPTKRSANAYPNVINNNPTQYQYPRMLALILQENISIPPNQPLPSWKKVLPTTRYYEHKIFGRTESEDRVEVLPPPMESNIIFNNLIDEIRAADYKFTPSELAAIRHLYAHAKPRTHIGLAALLENLVSRNENIGIDYSLIPKVISFIRLNEAIESVTRELSTIPDHVRNENSGDAKQVPYAGLAQDELTPIFIMILNKYHRNHLPELLTKFDELMQMKVIAGAEFSLVGLYTAADYMIKNPNEDFTANGLASTEPTDDKKLRKIAFYEAYMAQLEAMSVQETIAWLPNTVLAGGEVAAKDLHPALSHVYRGSQSDEERRLNTALNSDELKLRHINIDNIINLVKSARDSYLELKRSDHKKDFDKLITTITRIAYDNKENKESRMYAAIEAAYLKEQKPPISIVSFFRKDSVNAEKFKDKLNTNQKKFHFPRMLAVIMQNPALQSVIETDAQRKTASYTRVMPGADKRYKTIAPITAQYGGLKAGLNAEFRKLVGNDNASIGYSSRHIDNAIRYKETLLPAWRINQIAEHFEKTYRFPKFLIADMLNTLIQEMRDHPEKDFTLADAQGIAKASYDKNVQQNATYMFWDGIIDDNHINRMADRLFEVITPLKNIVTNDETLLRVNDAEPRSRPRPIPRPE